MPYAAISATASGDNTIVAAVGTRKIRVLNYTVASAGTVTAKWKSGSTDLSGAMPLVASSVVSAAGGSHNANGPEGVLETAGGEALILNLSGAVAVGGHIRYEVLS